MLVSITIHSVSPISAQEIISIEGIISNGTNENIPLSGIKIDLDIFHFGNNLETVSSTTDDAATFMFEAVPAGNGYGYIISTNYQGATYKYESDYPIQDGQINLKIYDSSNDMQKISMPSYTIIVTGTDVKTQSIKAMGLVGVSNAGVHTFIPKMNQPGNMDFLRFTLPEFVSDLDVQSNLRGGEILQVDLGFAITTPVPPGSHELAYTFTSSYQNGEFLFDHALPFGTQRFRVLIPEDMGRVKSQALQPMQRVVIGDKEYQGLESSALSPGSKLLLEFYGLPQPTLWQKTQRFIDNLSIKKWSVPISMSLILAFFYIAVLFRIRTMRLKTSDYSTHLQSEDSLIEEIAKLEQKFLNQEIDSAEYEELRKILIGEILYFRRISEVSKNFADNK